MARYNALHQELVWMHPNLSTYYRNSKTASIPTRRGAWSIIGT